MTSSLKTIGYKKRNKSSKLGNKIMNLQKTLRKHIILIFVLCLGLLFFHTRGLYFLDDGYILSAAKRVYDGQIPYRDFHFVYTPLTIYVDTLAFKLFGLSILATRIMDILISIATVYILLKITQILTKKKYLHYSAILLFLAWGPTHTNFIFPTQLAMTTALFTCLLFLQGMQKKNTRYFFFASLTTFLIFLSKQNFGFAFLLVAVCFFLFLPSKRTMKHFIVYVCGLLLSVLFFFLLLLFSGVFFGFINDFYTFSMLYVLKEGAFTTRFFYEFSLYGFLKSLFYLSPLLISIVAGIVCLQKNKQFLFLPIFTFVFYITGIRPTTDYIHLTPLLAISCLSFILAIKNIKKSKIKTAIVVCCILLICIGFYTALWKNYYRWLPPLADNMYFESHQRIKIFAPDHSLSKITEAIDSQTKPNDYIFTTFYSPIFYFTADRKSPTRFDLFEEFTFYTQYEKEVIDDIERKKTALIITAEEYPTGFLAGYIKNHYRKFSRVEGVYLWERL